MVAEGAGPASATVPMVLDHNRLTVEISFRRGDGSLSPLRRRWVRIRAVTAVIVAEPLARELGQSGTFPPCRRPGHGRTVRSPGKPGTGLKPGRDAAATVEGMKLSVRSGRFAIPGVRPNASCRRAACAALHVVFDYPARQLTVARPGVLTPVGAAVPCRVNRETGLFLVEATIDGEKVALGVDSGFGRSPG